MKTRNIMIHSKGKKDYKFYSNCYYTNVEIKANGYLLDFVLSDEDFKQYFNNDADQVYDFFSYVDCNGKLFNKFKKIWRKL